MRECTRIANSAEELLGESASCSILLLTLNRGVVWWDSLDGSRELWQQLVLVCCHRDRLFHLFYPAKFAQCLWDGGFGHRIR
jgi:hypothetical protein